MKKSELERIESLIARFRITKGKDFSLKDFDPRDTGELKSADKEDAKEMQATGVGWLAEQQDVLYAQDRWALLLVFQAMDAAGKDGTIKHVASGINPQGCEVTSFKQPSAEDLDHDYLWRHMKHVPARGQIGIFNRSYYEEVLVVKVHQEVLAKQKLPPSLVTNDIWSERYEDIGNFERYLTRNGVRILKFFLHVSKDEAEAPVHATSRRAGEELEVPIGRRRGARALVGLSGTPTRRRSATPRPNTRRGTWYRPTTNGSPGWSCSAPS